MIVRSPVKKKDSIVIGFGLALSFILFVTACTGGPVAGSPTVAPTKEIATPFPATEVVSVSATPALTQSAMQTVTSTVPDTLGTVQYLQYSYSLNHSYDFDSCTFDPYVCPDVYYTLLSDVHTWMYTQVGQTAWLEFNLNDDYQIRPPDENDTVCAVTQDTENRYRVGVTCEEIGEYILKFGLVNEAQQLTYPLILQLVNVPELSPPPAIIPPELTVEEYELAQHPDIEPLSFKPIIGNSNAILAKHKEERGQPIEGMRSVLLANGQLIQAEETSQATGLPDPSHVLNITITRNGNEIFTTQSPVSPIPAFRGLWAIENHWFAEIAVTQDISFRSFTTGDIFKDGISLNEIHGYAESFGFQLLYGKPFYFFEKFGRVGISYNRQDISLGYDYVPHHRCCSAGELNPKMYENMVGFFAVRDDKWYYVEIGVFK
jgi:hypothetical protein